MKYLITGGAGFIGSHLSDALVARGDSVVVLDNFTTGSKENLSGVASSVSVVSGDISDSTLVTKLVGESDFVVHLACQLEQRTNQMYHLPRLQLPEPLALTHQRPLSCTSPRKQSWCQHRIDSSTTQLTSNDC